LKYLIIGNGIAGITAAENIRKADPRGEIKILTDEKYPFYSRIRLIDFLSRNMKEETLIMKGEKWYADNGIELLSGARGEKIDHASRKVETDDGSAIGYDKLLIATGGVSFVPPFPGAEREGVFTLRTLDDAKAINSYAGKNKRVVIVGGGVLGLEAGFNLIQAGNSVEVVEFFPRLLPRQMDGNGAAVLQNQLESFGFRFYLNAKTKEITGEGKADGLLLEDGRRIEADMVIVSAGVRPADTLAKDLGLQIGKGVVVNDRMETSIEGIYAAGDVIEHNGIFYGLWAASMAQGETAGKNMAGVEALYKGTIMSNSLKVAGVKLFSAGDIDADGKYDDITFADSVAHVYKKMVIKDGKIIGIILYGDVGPRMKLVKAMEEKRDISGLRDALAKWDISAL